EKDTYGILVIDGTEAVVATLKGRRVEIIKSFTSGIPGKSRAGGQSARRFERIREQDTNEYYKRDGDQLNEIMLKIPDLKRTNKGKSRNPNKIRKARRRPPTTQMQNLWKHGRGPRNEI